MTTLYAVVTEEFYGGLGDDDKFKLFTDLSVARMHREYVGQTYNVDARLIRVTAVPGQPMCNCEEIETLPVLQPGPSNENF